MMKNNTNLVSSAKVYHENQYAEFTTLFRIPFKPNNGEYVHNHNMWRDLIGSWSKTCILALEMRMDACVSMLFRNRDNVIMSDQYCVVFKKSNGQIHSFNHESFKTMQDMVKALQLGDWESVRINKAGIRQLQKALYWISEEERKDHGPFSFGQLISFLDECTL